MAVIHWFNPDTGDTQFTVEFDESTVESEFSELVYGLIENADSWAHRRNETIVSQRECIAALRDDAREFEARELYNAREMNQLKLMLENMVNGEIVPLESDVEYGLPNPEFNNMGDNAYAKANL